MQLITSNTITNAFLVQRARDAVTPTQVVGLLFLLRLNLRQLVSGRQFPLERFDEGIPKGVEHGREYLWIRVVECAGERHLCAKPVFRMIAHDSRYAF